MNRVKALGLLLFLVCCSAHHANSTTQQPCVPTRQGHEWPLRFWLLEMKAKEIAACIPADFRGDILSDGSLIPDADLDEPVRIPNECLANVLRQQTAYLRRPFRVVRWHTETHGHEILPLRITRQTRGSCESNLECGPGEFCACDSSSCVFFRTSTASGCIGLASIRLCEPPP